MPTPANSQHWTVLGGSGFVGRAVAAELQRLGCTVRVPSRDDPAWLEGDLGHVIYAIGRTADFRSRPFDTVAAHVDVLATILQHARFDSLLYLSSTRVYQGAAAGGEQADLVINPNHPDHLYNLSKLMGESLCLNDPRMAVRVVRLANIYGANMPPSFLRMLLAAAASNQPLTLQDHPQTAKDYISLNDVAMMLPRIALSGTHRLYNLASGQAVTHQEIIDLLQQKWPDWRCATNANAPLLPFPLIDTNRLQTEFAFHAIPFELGFFVTESAP
jgi:nucleoside-diphosphate-sugar epimerase